MIFEKMTIGNVRTGIMHYYMETTGKIPKIVIFSQHYRLIRPAGFRAFSALWNSSCDASDFSTFVFREIHYGSEKLALLI